MLKPISPCPVAYYAGVTLPSISFSDSFQRALRCFRWAADVLIQCWPNENFREFIFNHETIGNIMSFIKNDESCLSWQAVLVRIIVDMANEIAIAPTDRSALARFGAQYKNYRELVAMYRPDLLKKDPLFNAELN